MPPRRQLVIELGDADALVRLLGEVKAAGSGWLNLRPEIAEDTAVPSTPSSLAIFSKRGPAIPLVTWTPATGGNRPEPTSVGVQHGLASGLAKRLVGTAAAIPPTWRVAADHPRRGLVALVPSDVPDAAVASWMLSVADLTSVIPHTGRAEVLIYG
jgi:hypothetical protein